mmetsp:Transcript_24933/g.61250  ORF Transcript_24933/g.61250 Transcript_24933/m.61250 type:complete len:829 (+) Transcript_24933:70-2556(+)
MGCGASAESVYGKGNVSRNGESTADGSPHIRAQDVDPSSHSQRKGSAESVASGGRSPGLTVKLGSGIRRDLPDLDPNLGLAQGPNFERGMVALLDRTDALTPAKQDLTKLFQPLMEEHARFLINFVMTFQLNSQTKGINPVPGLDMGVVKPMLETRQFKSHTMDNVRVRKMCDEMLCLEDTSHKMADESAKGKPWMRTLQIARGKHINSLKMNNNPDVTIGGYFIISQMLGYIRGLVSLDLSSNELKGAEARVLALGMKFNRSIQDLHMKENSIGSEGATSMAEALKINTTLLLLDLRMNNIRGPGVCVLTDSMSGNTTLTELDLRWNYAGESSDYVEMALLDLQRFCVRNMRASINSMRKDMEAKKLKKEASDPANRPESESPHESTRVSEASTEHIHRENHTNNKSHTDKESNNATASPEGGKKVEILPELGVLEEPSALALNGEGIDEDRLTIGRLEVTILSAKNLPQVIWTSGKDGEFLGLPQAYCVFQLNKQKEQTSIMRKDWSPFWNHTFSMNVRSVWNVCSVRVMHSKTLSRFHRDDSTIGTANLPVGAVINWRGVSRGSDGTWRAYHRPHLSGRGTTYTVCRGKDRFGKETDTFDTAELAARAYDERAIKQDLDKAVLNFAGDCEFIGQHVKEELFPLAGEDGVDVIGVQAGVNSTVRMRLKYFDLNTNYMEINLERASSLPKMDAGLGSCDAYVVLIVGDYQYRSRVVRNSLDPEFNQTFRIAVPDDLREIELRVQLWDWDRFDEDDHMGDVVMKLTIDKVVSGSLNGGYGVISSEGMDYVKNAQGEKSIIHLRFTYFPATVSTKAKTSKQTPKTPMLI